MRCTMRIESQGRQALETWILWDVAKLATNIEDLRGLGYRVAQHLRGLREHWRLAVLGLDWRPLKVARYRAKFEALGRPLNLTEQDVFDRLLK